MIIKKLYIFDFDGTITNRDSFILFTYFSLNFFKYFKYWASVICLFPFLSRSELKEMFFLNFRNFNLKEFKFLCANFNSLIIRKIIKKSFLEYLKKIDENSKILIVSASIANYLKPWCSENGFELISTELEVINGNLTGKFLTPNCNGDEKVRRIKENYDLLDYDEIHVFGNSKGDFQMLQLGTHKYYNFFK